MSGPREEKKRMRRPEICGRYISLGTPERLAVEALSPYGVQGGPFFSLFSSPSPPSGLPPSPGMPNGP